MSRQKREIPVADIGLNAGSLHARLCDHPGCSQAGTHRAPKHRRDGSDYYWFCMEHVRTYNASWDFFEGMTQTEIERFRKEAVTGHRPTWRLGDNPFRAFAEGRVRDEFGFLNGGFHTGPNGATADPRPLDSKHRRALAEMNLDRSVTLQEIKMRYKQLVKRYHPDANGGAKDAEERFKSITEAYNTLVTSGLF